MSLDSRRRRTVALAPRPTRVLSPPQQKRRPPTLAIAVVLVFVLAFPWLFSNPAVVSIAVFTLLFMTAAASWNLFSGYTGYLSLGSGAFSGLGAYALALLCQAWNIQGGYAPFLLLPLIGLIVGAVAIPLGWFFLRVRGYPFIILTIAISLLFQRLASNLSGITGGSGGMFLPLPAWNGYMYNLPFYYVALGLLLLTFIISWRLRYSRYGLSLLAIRDDEDRVRGMGKNTTTVKLAAFVISAFLQGMMGAVLFYFVGSITPQTAFDPMSNLLPALMVMLGGAGTLTGPLLGALLVAPLQQYLTLLFGTIGLDLILFSALFLVTIFLLPDGIVPGLSRAWTRWGKARWNRLYRSLFPRAASEEPNEYGYVDRRKPVRYGRKRWVS